MNLQFYSPYKVNKGIGEQFYMPVTYSFDLILAEKIETVVAIISGLIVIIGALATTLKKRKKLKTLCE